MVLYAETTLDTERMTLLLDLASGVIRRFTGQHLDLVEGDQVEFGPTTRTTLFLPERPVNAISEVTVDAVATDDFDWTRWGTIENVPSGEWSAGAIVTYDHGYEPDSDELSAVKAVCLGMATRAFTLNERSASEALGPTLMESAGYAPEVFLTPGEKSILWDLGAVPVG
jgi:hypothetical protein